MQQVIGERFIICGGNGIEPWVAEDEILKMDRESAIDWIAAGNLEDVALVIAFDLSNGTCRDATSEIGREVMTRWAHEGEIIADWQRDFVERHVSIQAANSFAREAA